MLSKRPQAHRLFRSPRSAAVVVEFAIAIPLILLFAVGVADFGRIAYFQQIVANAARTAAESGATHSFTAGTKELWESQLYAAALEEMQNAPGFDFNELGYTATSSVDDDGLAIVNVTVSYPFRTSVSWPGMPDEVTLSKSIEFRQFR